MASILDNILTLGEAGHAEKLRESKELMTLAHDAYWPIIQKGAQGDPSIAPDTWDFAVQRYASALSTLGKRGKVEAENFRFAADRQRKIALQRAALEQFKTPQAKAQAQAPSALSPVAEPIRGDSLTQLLQPPVASSPSAPSALPGGSPVEPSQPGPGGLGGQPGPGQPGGGMIQSPENITRALANRESAVDTAKFEAQRRAQAAMLETERQAKLKGVEALRGSSGQIDLNPETMIKAGALGIPLPMLSRGLVPQKIETDASQLSDEQKALYQSLYGQSPQGKVTMLRNNLSGETVGMFPGWAGTQTVTTPSGGLGNLNRGTGTVTPIPGAVPNAQATQHLVTGPSGQQFFVRPLDVAPGSAVPGAVNPQFVPRTTTSTRIVDIGGQLTPVQVSAISSKGGKAPTAQPKAPSPGAPAPSAPSAPSTRTGSALGPSPAQYKRQIENPLTPSAQSVVISAQPTRNLVDKAMVEMARMGMDKSSSPGTTFLPRLAYALGYTGSDGMGQFLGDLSMESITSAGAVLKTTGGVRAVQALQKAMVHTPEPWHDSGKLMYQKMKAIRARLDEVIKVAREEGRKYPGMTGGAAPTAVPGSRIKVRNRQGQEGTVPAEQLDQALREGYTRVQ